MCLPLQNGLLLLSETCCASFQGDSKLSETAFQGSILQMTKLKQAENFPNDREKILGLSKGTGLRNGTPKYLRGHPVDKTESGI